MVLLEKIGLRLIVEPAGGICAGVQVQQLGIEDALNVGVPLHSLPLIRGQTLAGSALPVDFAQLLIAPGASAVFWRTSSFTAYEPDGLRFTFLIIVDG